jgi:hypothetical protein
MPKTKAERLKEYIEKKKREDSISRCKMYARLKHRERQRKEEQNFNMHELRKIVESMIQQENKTSRFGKKEKKDISGMLKKILLYGGLPTLLVVSLGILSNTKIKRNQKQIKIKVNKKEENFKKDFKDVLKVIMFNRYNNLKKIEKDKLKNQKDDLVRFQRRESTDTQKLSLETNRIIKNINKSVKLKEREYEKKPIKPLFDSILSNLSTPGRQVKNPTTPKTEEARGKTLRVIRERIDTQPNNSKPQFITFNKDMTYKYSSTGNYYIKDNIVYNKKNVKQKKFSINKGSLFYEKNTGGIITEYKLKQK